MINTIQKLTAIATELGATTYEMAQTGGLLSAYKFLELHTKGWNQEWCRKVKVVTEAYVRFEDREELDRIFLYAENTQSDKELLEQGAIEDGKLVISYGRLKSLATKGYTCLYHRSPDGHNGRSFAYYHAAFGENKRMLPFQMWDDSAHFAGNGYNRALLVATDFEDVFVMPDIHTVRESIRVVHAENLIREKHDAHFHIERIYQKQEKETIPEAYGRLQQQMAYIKAHYSELYELVWHRKGSRTFEGAKVSVGICMDDCRTHGICWMPDGTMRKIPNIERAKMPVHLKYYFNGYKNYADTDTSTVSLPVIMRNIVASAEATYKVQVDKIYITVVNNALSPAKMSDSRTMTEAGLPKAEYVDYYTALMSAYGKEEAVKQMQEDDVALVYDLGELRLAPALIKKCEGNTFKLLHRIEKISPEDCMFGEDEDFSYVYEDTFQDVYMDEYGEPMLPGLCEVMWSDMDHFMLDEGLSVLGISNQRAADRKALQKIHSNWLRVKRQLLRSDSAPIVFDNGYLSIAMDYPIDRFEQCFALILRNSKAALEKLFEESGISRKALSAAVLAGESSEYPFVQEHIEQFTGKKASIVNMPEYAAARGAVLYNYRNKFSMTS